MTGNKRLHRIIVIISLVIFIISSIGSLVGNKLQLDALTVYGLLLVVLPILTIITSYTIKYQDSKLLRKGAKLSLIAFPVCMVGLGAYFYITDKAPNLFLIVILCLVGIMGILGILQMFVLSNVVSLRWTAILIMLLILGIILKRYHLPLAGAFLTFACAMLSLGGFMFGIQCLFVVEKVPYLRILSFLGGLLNSIGFLGLMLKLQHWPGAGYLIIVGFSSMIVGTIYVLVTLSSSGYIDWQPFHKKLFRKVLIPWIVVFVLFILRYMLPDVNNIIWSSSSGKQVTHIGFGLTDYPVENRNGLTSK
jgi:hypothetical protein